MFYHVGSTPKAGNLTYQQHVKEKNIKQIFDFLRSGECESRAELVKAVSLSATSISALVEELQQLKYLEESGLKYTTQPGRRPILLQFNGNSRFIATFAVTRRGIRFSMLNLRCEVVESIFVDFESTQYAEGDAGAVYSACFEDILLKQSRLYSAEKTLCVGITIPGIYRRNSSSFMMASSIDIRFSLQSMADFQRRIGIPVYVANTTVCRAYAEKKHLDALVGDASPIQDLIYVNVCDGVGASIVSKGNIFTGPNNAAGEIGHMIIDYNGRPCACGNRGCLERYVNLNVILDDCRTACREAGRAAPASFEELSECFQGIPEVDHVLNQAADYLSCGIYNMICATGIQHIALGGGIECLGDRFLAQLTGFIQSRSVLFCDDLKLDYAAAGSNADDLGFAHYFLDKIHTITY